jgi:holo-[acyl-carrier protein] synthase
MILGIGTDLANIERIEGTIARFGPRFLNRVFTSREQAKAQSRPHGVAATYAKRWAAKEACSKALGTGLRMGIAWKDMAVSNLRSGQPVMHLTGWAAERLAEMTPPGHRAVVHVTLTDDHPWAQAFVVIEAVALDSPEPPKPALRKPGPPEFDPAKPDPAKPNPTELMPPRDPLP